jgi:hypothetical protein
MAFDIHALDKVDYDEEGIEAIAEKYQDALLELFLDSPEGQERAKADPEIGFWAYQFMYYGYGYAGVTLPRVDLRAAREIVEELFPRKISTFSPDEADDTIPELIAFWRYLKREYQLPHADAILRYLHQIESEFRGIMNDPANFGMAKSFFAQGQAMGFDMTDEEEINRFMNVYNAALLAGEADALPLPSMFGPPGSPLGASRSSRTRKAKPRKKKPRARVSRRQRKRKKRR